MNANIITRAPRWALLTGAGVTVGVIGLHYWRNRAAPADNSQTASTIGDPTLPTSTGSSPTPVIIPPVLNQTTGDSGGAADAASVLTAVSGIFSPIIDDFTSVIGAQQGSVTTVVAQEGADLQTAVGAVQSNNETWISALASGGLAPRPAASQPTIINPPHTPAQGPHPVVDHCPHGYPNKDPSKGRGPDSCYRCARDGRKWKREYQNGHTVRGLASCP